MNIKDLVKDLTPYGAIDIRRALLTCERHGLVPAPGVSSRMAAHAGRMSGATLFRPEWLRQISNVIDVGANVGQWAGFWCMAQQPKQIFSLEPNPASFAELKAKADHRPGWTCLNAAAGSQAGKMTFNVPKDSTSASILEIKTAAGWEDPDSIANPTKISVSVVRVDEVAKDWAEISLLKVDAEGFEGEVLKGAEGILQRTNFVLVELNWLERFANGSTIWEIHDFMRQRNFTLWGVGDTTFYGGRSVFCDGLFVRNDLVPKA